MQSGYSSIFASGLLATPRPNRHGSGDAMDTDTTPTSSKTYTTNFTNPFPPHGQDADMSSADADYFTSRSRASSTASTDSTAPRLRRRRSSLTVNPNGNPLASVRSPLRSAGAAFQRNLIGGSRSRSGSVNTEPANDVHGSAAAAPSIKGRMRSGSLGTALRSSRKASRKPPPAMPLPALPPLPPSATNEAFPTTPTRRPLLHRAHNSDNNAALTFGQSASYLRSEMAVPMKLQTGSCASPMESMHPSPVDPVVPFTTSMSMKEN